MKRCIVFQLVKKKTINILLRANLTPPGVGCICHSSKPLYLVRLFIGKLIDD